MRSLEQIVVGYLAQSYFDQQREAFETLVVRLPTVYRHRFSTVLHELEAGQESEFLLRQEV